MNRSNLQQVSKGQLVEFCLKLQCGLARPVKTSCTWSLPPSMDKNPRRENSKPGGAKHKASWRLLSDAPDKIIERRPAHYDHCAKKFNASESITVMGSYEHIDIPPIVPHVVHHLRMACRCACGSQTKSPLPDAAVGSPFGPGIMSLTLYMKSFQLCSYQRLQAMFKDIFGLKISQGGIMNMLRRASARFSAQHSAIIDDLRPRALCGQR